MKVSRLDLYLAAGMRRSAQLTVLLRNAAVAPAVLTAVRQEARESGLTNPQTLSKTDLLGFFGPPNEDRGAEITYGLSLWRNHFYKWRVLETGIVTHVGFRLRSARELPSWLPRSLSSVAETFETFSDTESEVLDVMGEADLRLGWGTSWTLYYGPEEDGTDLVFDFDFGLLQDVRTEPSAVLEHRTEGDRGESWQ